MKNSKIELSEHQIQNQIIDYLRTIGFFVWRNNSGRIFTESKGKKRMIVMGQAGLPDLFAIKKGKFIGLEVKRPGGKVTDLQFRMLKELQDHGASTAVVRSVEQLEAFCRIVLKQ